jgi:XTP/dITP diphosphohydrolase
MKKALTLARVIVGGRHQTLPAFTLADDSGLEVDALNGAPGVYSARFAALDKEGNSSDLENRARLLRLLRDVPAPKRTARFQCVLALTPVREPAKENASPVCYADELEMETELFEGACEGGIGFSEKGQGGFGYDSLFTPQGHSNTFGELPEDVKNRISHRAQALAKLQVWLKERFRH